MLKLIIIGILTFVVYYTSIIPGEIEKRNTGMMKYESNVYDAGTGGSPKDGEGGMPDREKLIFLTFDDGPSDIITDRILDVLKDNDVKGTFFVVGKEIKGRESILKRINDEGHAIGLHTYSHNFKKIYNSQEYFIAEMNKTKDLVYEITGKKSNIIRFPGGSHNRVNMEFIDKLHNDGFKTYDWTHNCEDSAYPRLSPDNLFKHSLRKIISKKKAPGVVLLMHCMESNKNTIKALPRIINYYKENGYIFKIIDESTSEYYSE